MEFLYIINNHYIIKLPKNTESYLYLNICMQNYYFYSLKVNKKN